MTAMRGAGGSWAVRCAVCSSKALGMIGVITTKFQLLDPRGWAVYSPNRCRKQVQRLVRRALLTRTATMASWPVGSLYHSGAAPPALRPAM